jgi:uroporphyrinogen-III synthase
MRVLITRPRDEAEALAGRIESLGFIPLIDPMIEIRMLSKVSIDSRNLQAVVFTSANGVRALANAPDGAAFFHDLTVFAVGTATAAAARAAGFTAVIEGPGTVEDLARIIADRCSPSRGPLLHVSGSVVARDLAPLLAETDLTVNRAVLYESVQATQLQGETRDGFAHGTIGAVLFFSPRTAQTFVNLVTAANLVGTMGSVVALTLSPAVAEALAPLAFARMATAIRPTTDALLESLVSLNHPSHSATS